MMYTVTVKNACSCFLRSALPEHQEFTDKASAKKETDYLLDRMNREFCQRHTFALIESSRKFTLYIRPR